MCGSKAKISGRVSKDAPEKKLVKSRYCRARTTIFIRKLSWVVIVGLQIDSQYMAAHSVWGFRTGL
jgi:hypothetical protein